MGLFAVGSFCRNIREILTGNMQSFDRLDNKPILTRQKPALRKKRDEDETNNLKYFLKSHLA